MKWSLGRIMQVHAGKDGVVRGHSQEFALSQFATVKMSRHQHSKVSVLIAQVHALVLVTFYLFIIIMYHFTNYQLYKF